MQLTEEKKEKGWKGLRLKNGNWRTGKRDHRWNADRLCQREEEVDVADIGRRSRREMDEALQANFAYDWRKLST